MRNTIVLIIILFLIILSPSWLKSQTLDIKKIERTTYCNEFAGVWTIKITDKKVLIDYVNLNHLDRTATYRGYLKNNKIYIKSLSTPKFSFDKKQNFQIWNEDAKKWDKLKPCNVFEDDNQGNSKEYDINNMEP